MTDRFGGQTIRQLAIILLVAAVPGVAQDASDAARPFYGSGGPGGSRAAGFAQAFTAIADDGSALYYNPAGLALQTHTEINFGLRHIVAGTEGSGTNSPISATRLGNLFVVLPGEGSLWTVALGYHSVRAFERSRTLSAITTDPSDPETVTLTETVVEEGQLSSAVAGVGYQVSPRLSIGGTVNLLFGANIYDDTEQSVFFDGTVLNSSFLHVEPTYRGLGFSLGVLAMPMPNWRLGFLIQSPQSIAVTEISYDDQDPSEFSREYTTRNGFSLRVGSALNIGPLLLSADIFWIDYSQIRFESDLEEEFIDPQDSSIYYLDIDLSVNNTLRSTYNSAPGFAFGGELLLPMVNVKLRGGYRYRPALKPGTFEESDRRTITAGASFVVTSGLKMDITYSHSYWDRTLAESSIFWHSGIGPLRSTIGTITANLVMRL